MPSRSQKNARTGVGPQSPVSPCSPLRLGLAHLHATRLIKAPKHPHSREAGMIGFFDPFSTSAGSLRYSTPVPRQDPRDPQDPQDPKAINSLLFGHRTSTGWITERPTRRGWRRAEHGRSGAGSRGRSAGGGLRRGAGERFGGSPQWSRTILSGLEFRENSPKTIQDMLIVPIGCGKGKGTEPGVAHRTKWKTRMTNYFAGRWLEFGNVCLTLFDTFCTCLS